MIGTFDPSQRRATVVGAGVAGLLIADRLDRAGFEVSLLEKSARAGGMIGTTQTPHGPAEWAAHSLLASAPVRELFSQMGIELLPTREKARYILRGGRSRRLPLGPLEVLALGWRAYFSRARPNEAALTMDQWADRHLGRAARDFLLAPFVRGIYGAELGELTVGAAFPALVLPAGHSLVSYRLRKLLEKWGLRSHSGPLSARGERRPMSAPAPGMGALTDALAAKLRERLGARFCLGVEVTELPSAPNVVLALPAREAAALLEVSDRPTAVALRAVPYTPMLSVTVFARGADPRPRGVGVLVAPAERRALLGVLFNSSAFDDRARDPDVDSLTVMLGGSARSELLALPDVELRALVETELAGLFGSGLRILHQEIHRVERAIPRYGPDLTRAWTSARQGWCAQPGRVLFGNFSGQVSLRGMIETVAALEF